MIREAFKMVRPHMLLCIHTYTNTQQNCNTGEDMVTTFIQLPYNLYIIVLPPLTMHTATFPHFHPSHCLQTLCGKQ